MRDVLGTVGSSAKALHAQAAGMRQGNYYKTELVSERFLWLIT